MQHEDHRLSARVELFSRGESRFEESVGTRDLSRSLLTLRFVRFSPFWPNEFDVLIIRQITAR